MSSCWPRVETEFCLTLERVRDHLGFSVNEGVNNPKITILACIAQFLPQASCYPVCERRGVLSFITRILERALVTSTVIMIILIDVHTTCDVGTLFVDVKQCLAVLVVHPLLSTLLKSSMK